MREAPAEAGPHPVRFPNTNPTPKRRSAVRDPTPGPCPPRADLRHAPRHMQARESHGPRGPRVVRETRGASRGGALADWLEAEVGGVCRAGGGARRWAGRGAQIGGIQ